MNVEQLVRDSLRDLAVEQPSPGPGFADRVLAVRRRRRARRFTSVAVATAAVVAVSVAVPRLDGGRDDVRPAVLTDRQDGAPTRMIAAGQTVLAAYYKTKGVRVADGKGVNERTYWLLDPRTATYRKDSRWSYVAVAPGAKTAAVLERSLPAHRIGILDLTTGEVERWIPVDKGVGGLAYSNDGTRLVATTYDDHPDRLESAKSADSGPDTWIAERDTNRTGYLLLDPAGEGSAIWHRIPAGREVWGRADFAFTDDNTHLYARVIGEKDGMEVFYDLSGNEVAPPADEKYLRWDVPARLSPNGELAALGLTQEVNPGKSPTGKTLPGKSYSSIRDPLTGKEITKVRGGHLLAWVDDHRLLAWERTTGLNSGYKDRLVMVTIGSDKAVPLSGERDPDDHPERAWEPVFVTR